MRRQKLFGMGLLTLLFTAMVLSGCGKKEEAVVEPEIQEEEVVEEPEEEVESHEGEEISKLTGTWIDEDLVNVRPLAIMMGNTKSACPQSGIGKASIVYEIPVEGGITRLMSIIDDYKDLNRIGCVRSCRYYFVHYAMEYDAFYAHFGQSKYAKNVLSKSSVHNINGIEGASGKCYYRTKDRKAPHNAFADGQKIYDYLKNKGYSMEYESDDINHFTFASEDTLNDLTTGSAATYVSPGYAIDNPWYEYNEEDHNYYRFQYNGKHVDNESGEQLSCKNIIIQYVGIKFMDDNYSLSINTTAGGDGVFITNGKSIPITWSKDSDFARTKYMDENGNEITLNPGKTWILLVDKNKKNKVTIK